MSAKKTIRAAVQLDWVPFAVGVLRETAPKRGVSNAEMCPKFVRTMRTVRTKAKMRGRMILLTTSIMEG